MIADASSVPGSTSGTAGPSHSGGTIVPVGFGLARLVSVSVGYDARCDNRATDEHCGGNPTAPDRPLPGHSRPRSTTLPASELRPSSRPPREPIELPGGGATVRIGTASWTDPTMTAGTVFYPKGADTAEERLQYYAASSRWSRSTPPTTRCPSRAYGELWRDRTPPDFVFDVKAHALMTGQPTETKRLPKVIREALPAELAAQGADLRARPAHRAARRRSGRCSWTASSHCARPASSGRCCCSTRSGSSPSARAASEILAARETLAGHTFAVELRNGSWFNEKNARSDDALPDRQQAALRDGRRAAGLQERACPPVVAVTSPDLAVMRFHGRNADNWEKKGITPAERFRYLYDRERASRLGAATGRRGQADARRARADEQLLRQLRLDQRARAGRHPERSQGRLSRAN